EAAGVVRRRRLRNGLRDPTNLIDASLPVGAGLSRIDWIHALQSGHMGQQLPRRREELNESNKRFEWAHTLIDCDMRSVYRGTRCNEKERRRGMERKGN
ncbi:hypothetical protein PFISCL1PPCAC_18910, partial [Pristionchus fissidentatus]